MLKNIKSSVSLYSNQNFEKPDWFTHFTFHRSFGNYIPTLIVLLDLEHCKPLANCNNLFLSVFSHDLNFRQFLICFTCNYSARISCLIKHYNSVLDIYIWYSIQKSKVAIFGIGTLRCFFRSHAWNSSFFLKNGDIDHQSLTVLRTWSQKT